MLVRFAGGDESPLLRLSLVVAQISPQGAALAAIAAIGPEAAGAQLLADAGYDPFEQELPPVDRIGRSFRGRGQGMGSGEVSVPPHGRPQMRLAERLRYRHRRARPGGRCRYAGCP